MTVDEAVALVIRHPELKAVGLTIDGYIELVTSMKPETKFVEVKFPIKENIMIHTRPFFPVYKE
jgi:hypothetical protein